MVRGRTQKGAKYAHGSHSAIIRSATRVNAGRARSGTRQRAAPGRASSRLQVVAGPTPLSLWHRPCKEVWSTQSSAGSGPRSWPSRDCVQPSETMVGPRLVAPLPADQAPPPEPDSWLLKKAPVREAPRSRAEALGGRGRHRAARYVARDHRRHTNTEVPVPASPGEPRGQAAGLPDRVYGRGSKRRMRRPSGAVRASSRALLARASRPSGSGSLATISLTTS